MVKVIQGYVLNEVIGEGNFGLVYRATHKEKSGIFAVKVIPIEKFQQNQKLQVYMNNQIQALQAIGVSDYIIRFYEMIKSKNNCYLVYEYCNGGTLLNLIRKQQRLDEKRSLLIFKQLLEAFKVLNKNSIMHRDLKPENIFFMTSETQDEGKDQSRRVKLGDFGFCKGLKPDQNLAKTMLGSPIYMAPEVLKGESYTTKADIWSLGVILFEMLYGFCPYESKSIASLINTIDTQPVQLPNQVKVSERTQNYIKRMLTKDYFRRIGWVQLFGIKIDENGEYIDEPQLTASEDIHRGSTPNKKVFSSLFGSLSIGTAPSLPNNRSYSTIRGDDEKNKSNGNGNRHEGKYVINKRSIDEGQTGQQPQAQVRVSSQPKDQKKFYSQNYMSILSTPLSLKRIENQNESKSKEKLKVPGSYDRGDKNLIIQQATSPKLNPSPLSSPPIIYRQQRLTSMDNIDLIREQNQISPLVSSNNIEPIPFNKYRENIGMASNLSSKFLSDRSSKDTQRHSSQYGTSISNTNSQVLQLDAKRTNLLKLHDSITKTLCKAMSVLQQKFQIYKNSRQLSDFFLLKDLLQDSYIVLKMLQQKLKSITQSIKITQTSLLDMASIVNYEHIQVQKFIIEVRNQLIRCSAEIPNTPSGLQLSRVDRMENMNNFRELLKNRSMVQAVEQCF